MMLVLVMILMAAVQLSYHNCARQILAERRGFESLRRAPYRFSSGTTNLSAV